MSPFEVNLSLITIIMASKFTKTQKESQLYVNFKLIDLKLLQAHPLLTAHHAFSILNFHQENDFSLT